MPKEVVRKQEVESMRAADADRHKIAEQLKAALDEGRLSLIEYDERVRDAYAARTYGDLVLLVDDLPQAGVSAEEVNARRLAEERKAARKLPTALMVLWTIYGSIAAINVVVWILVAITVEAVYPWPIWLLVPGVALGATTIGVQNIKKRR
ncbi:DUF1707 domain-containing protein [Winogradskya consettensis]|uniref:DUF1707 domain-containing protein n=1 Tax=Winogradskya consettensis TaxID=113560 RepID=A0A919S947_9ACTN|nr:DUF1707 domain-containing protein [Actinoplanes consettensis]GIM67435.1 hypothetical protein Aco04nite_06330 [Actinoplanes consettensis]